MQIPGLECVSYSPVRNSVLEVSVGRILCLADVRGNLTTINQLVQKFGAQAVIHSGDFGFYEYSSIRKIGSRTLRHLVQYNTKLSKDKKLALLGETDESIRKAIVTDSDCFITEFPEYLENRKSFVVPVFTIWGSTEDVEVLEKFRNQEYRIHNLNIIDEATTYRIEVGGIALRLLGLGGAFIPPKLFDNGEGKNTIAGGEGKMWTTALQMGELVRTATKVYDEMETRVLVSFASPGREGLVTQLALALKADFLVSAGLHFRYCTIFNEFSIQPDYEAFIDRLEVSKSNFLDIWQSVREIVESHVDLEQHGLLRNILQVVQGVPGRVQNQEEPFLFKNLWNISLPDSTSGSLMFIIKGAVISTETHSKGVSFAKRIPISMLSEEEIVMNGAG